MSVCVFMKLMMIMDDGWGGGGEGASRWWYWGHASAKYKHRRMVRVSYNGP